MRRREFVAALGSAAAAWPLAARAQQAERMRRIGVLMNASAEDPEAQTMSRHSSRACRSSAGASGAIFASICAGVATTRTARAGTRRTGGALAGRDLAAGGPVVSAMQRATRTVPIVFAQSIDPVGAGVVDSLARPGGNVTGFHPVRIRPERQVGGATQGDRARTEAHRRSSLSSQPAGIGQWAIIQAAATVGRNGSEPHLVRDAGEIERGVAAFARAPNGGLILTGSAMAVVHRDSIVTFAARHRLPAVYPCRHFVAAGG